MPIRVLSEDTINKIAAGEVIERPANAVKELVENSIDAGSRSVEIEIKESGKKLIRVTDDGCGILPDELPAALTRHATSKISDFDDLHKVSSLGFRGEALPSIASVSDMLIQSHAKGAASGLEMRLRGGKQKSRGVWAGKPGTNIEIAALFFNTPARLKFLKSATTEKHNIFRLIESLALAWPSISFKVISDGKTVLNAPKAATAVERIFDILGGEFADSLIPLEINHAKMKLSGFITASEKSRPNKNDQFLFVNNRPVQLTKVIARSVYDAYSENLPKGRHPGILLFMEIPPSEIDVNIHPTKREIRIAAESGLYDLIYRSIKTALNRPLTVRAAENEPAGAKSAVLDKFASVVRETHEPSYGRNGFFGETRGPGFKPAEPAFPVKEFSNTGSGRNVLQVFGMYIVAQKGDELMVVDQHAAAERIRYERYRAELDSKKVQVQQMLLPETVDMPASRSSLLKENLPLFREAGWELEEFGANTFRITGVPAVLGSGLEIRNVLNSILDSLAEETKLAETEKLEKVIRAACRKSIKAGDTVSQQEMERLMEDLMKCAAPYTCPHGRPTVFKITRKELQKYFGRS